MQALVRGNKKSLKRGKDIIKTAEEMLEKKVLKEV